MAKILIADDHIVLREGLRALLDSFEQWNVVAEASNGFEVLDLVEKHTPDLVILDLTMPKLSGFEVCQKLKGDSQTSGIMILMVTALNELGDIERAVEAGTDDFLSKPVNKIELLKRVENMLTLRGVTDELERLRQYIEKMEGSR